MQRRIHTVQIVKFSMKDYFSKCDQICSFLRIWSHLLKKSLMEDFIFCAVLKLCQTSLMKTFLLNSLGFLVVRYFRKTFHHRFFKRVLNSPLHFHTAQKRKFFIKDFFSKCDQILSNCLSCVVLRKRRHIYKYTCMYVRYVIYVYIGNAFSGNASLPVCFKEHLVSRNPLFFEPFDSVF